MVGSAPGDDHAQMQRLSNTMTREARIKKEAGGGKLSSEMAAMVNRRSAQRRMMPSAPSTASVSDEPSGHRHLRSGAPSIETRHQLTSHLADDTTELDEEDTENCMLMEVRPRVKSQSEEEVLASQSKSFSSTGLGFQLIGQRLKTINDALGKLQALGIQHVTNLPELVLVGDQSSGKSSLMSALANLNLPRSTGICTRCPIHIRISSGTRQWRCNVSLHQDYRFVPHQGHISETDVTADNPFPPWKKMAQRVVKDFKTIEFTNETGSMDIEQVIRWAQVAILNDGEDHSRFIPAISTEPGYAGREEELRRLLEQEGHTKAKFSPNRVALEIRGPDLADMSFYDLPGVFSTTPEVEDDYLVKVVKNLAAEYISHPSAIILWAVPMNTDPDISPTFSLIRGGGALERCVSVLTKADLVPSGGYGQWIEMLSGNSYRTSLGYYITARPETSDPDAFEEAFFNRRAHAPNSTVGWPINFSAFDDKCGVSRLKVVLSQKLGEEFAKSVPQVRRKIEMKLRQVEKKLQQHPDMPQNPELEIRHSIVEFTIAVNDYFNKDAHSEWRGIQESFANHVLSLKPRFIVKPEEPYRVEADGVINILDNESVISAASTPMKRRHPSEATADHLAGFASFATPNKRRAGPNGVKLEATPSNRPQPFASPGMPGRRPGRTLREIRNRIQSRKCPGKPDLIPEEVYEDLCREAIEPWHIPLTQLVADTTNTLNLKLGNILGRAFARLDKRVIYKQASQHVSEFVKDAMAVLTCRLRDLYKLETRQLFTMDEQAMRRHREDESRTLDRHRHHYRCIAQFGDGRGPLKEWGKMTEEEKSQEAARTAKEAQKLGKDDFEAELQVAAYVRGYYLTAASRYIDTVLLHIASGVFPDLAERVNGYLEAKLDLPGTGQSTRSADQNVFDELMAEDAKDAERRDFLKRELEKFRQAKASIHSLEAPATTGIHGDTDTTLVTDDEDDDMLVEMEIDAEEP